MKILIVEDEAYSRQSLVKQIRALDPEGRFTLLEASNGQQGLDICAKEEVGLVITDIRMPLLSGTALLRSLREAHPDIRVVLLSGFADFEYAQEAIRYGATDYLLKPARDEDIRELLSQYAQYDEERKTEQSRIGEDSLGRTIYRCILGKEDESDQVNASIFQRVFPSYSLLCLQLPGEDFYEREVLHRQVQATLRSNFRLLHTMRNGWVLVVKGTEEGHIPDWPRLSAALSEEELDCQIGISRIHSGFEGLPRAHREALLALKGKLFAPRLAHPYHSVENLAYQDQQALELLRIHLEKGAEEAAQAQAAKMLDAVLAQKNVILLENLLMRLVMLLQSAAGSGESARPAPSNSWPEDVVLWASGPGDVRIALRQAVGRACGGANPEEKSIGRQALEYIDRNFNRDLSLKYLAENVFHVNHAYLSYLISEQTGTNFTTYLRQVRMRKARELLADPALSVTDVALLSGYNSTSRFIQVFKRSEGITPKRMRAALREEG